MAKAKKDIQLSEVDEKALNILISNYEMLEKSKEEAQNLGRDKAVKQLEVSQEEVIERIKLISPTKAKELSKKKNKKDGASILQHSIEEDIVLNNTTKEKYSIFENEELSVKDYAEIMKGATHNVKNTETNNIDRDVAYDVITLPSKGECYAEKKERLPVSYLTAYDENFITSPNLYKDGLVIDFLLKQKIMNKDVDVDDLCSGDADAIILFLRATSYGTDFPITVQDPTTKQVIETTVDLSTLKYKPFELKGDENGYFSFTLPITKDVVKFKFLTRKDEKTLKMLSKLESSGIKALTMAECLSTLSEGIKSDNLLDGRDKQECLKYLQTMNNWVEKLKSKKGLAFSKLITNRLELAIMSINDNDDREYIRKYVRNMVAKDSLELRKYMMKHEPGIDFEIEVQRPESLGGGSFKTFLEWDDSVFLNFT